MRLHTAVLIGAIVGPGAVCATAGLGRLMAADCVDTRMNNSAFSSSFLPDAKPCPTPIAPLTAPVAKPVKSKPAQKTAGAKPVVDPDKSTVTTTPDSTLITDGNTTVCIKGSVSETVVIGSASGARRGQTGPADHRSSDTGCN